MDSANAGKPKLSPYDRVSIWRGVQRAQGGKPMLVNLSANERRALEILAKKGERTALLGRLILDELRRQVAAGALPPIVLEQLDAGS